MGGVGGGEGREGIDGKADGGKTRRRLSARRGKKKDVSKQVGGVGGGGGSGARGGRGGRGGRRVRGDWGATALEKTQSFPALKLRF